MSNNKEKAKDFFDIDILNKIYLPDLAILSDLEIFDNKKSFISFNESLHFIYINRVYTAYFYLFNKKAKTVALKLDKSFELCSQSHIKLNAGVNIINFAFKLVDKSKTRITLTGKIGNLTFYSLYNLEVQNKIYFNLPSQKNAFNYIFEGINMFSNFLNTNILYVEGPSGIGKSYLLSKVLNLVQDDTVFYYDLSFNQIDNMHYTVLLILFIFFPYLDPQSVTKEYLSSLDMAFSEDFINLINCKDMNNLNEFNELTCKLEKTDYLFNRKISINKRIIVIDNYHRISEDLHRFYLQFHKLITQKMMPILFIISSQPTDYSFNNIIKYKYSIEKKDILAIITQSNIFDFPIPVQYFYHFSNLIEVFQFLSYIQTIKISITNVLDFRLASQNFANSQLYNNMIYNKFSNFLNKNPKTKPILDEIYWSKNSCIVNVYEFEEISPLIKAELILLSENDELAPYHELYINVYRKNFQRPKGILNHENLDTYYYILNDFSSRQQINDSIEQVKKLTETRKFKEVVYILANIFEYEDENIAIARLGKKNYYKLYTYYAIASTHTSDKTSGRQLFENIMEKTKNELDLEFIKIYSENMWEALNSYYEWMDFDNAKKLIKEIIEKLLIINDLEFGDKNILSNIRYHDVMVIKTLIESEENIEQVQNYFYQRFNRMNEHNFEYRAYSYSIRYAITLNSRDMKKSIEISKKSLDYFEKNFGCSEKYYFWSAINYYFLDMIYNNNYKNITTINKLLNKEKTLYFNDYRKRIFAIAAYFLSKKEIEKAELFLFDDIFATRKLRNRQYGYFLQVSALYYALKSMNEKAIDSLNKALEIFKLSSYTSIITHNLKTLETEKFSSNKIKFCMTDKEELKQDIFYIDSRMIG